jgi:predicted RNA-binding Zn ribbon-like protein
MTSDPSLALAFLNSSAPPGGGPDLWTSPDDLSAWLTQEGVPPDPGVLARLTPPEMRILRDDALRLRRALAELVEGWTARSAPVPGLALLELNRVLEARPRHGLALRIGSRGYEIHAQVADVPLSGLLAPVAEAAALLLAREDPGRVRRCSAPGCGHWFLDTSKNQRRRWCSMAVCGNRAKVAAHHGRKRGGG